MDNDSGRARFLRSWDIDVVDIKSGTLCFVVERRRREGKRLSTLVPNSHTNSRDPVFLCRLLSTSKDITVDDRLIIELL
jgi:hypothetical protein